MQFGKNAAEKDVIGKQGDSIREFGWRKVAQEMISASSIQSAVSVGSKWRQNRKFLLVCYYIWPSSEKDNDFEFRKHLKNMHKYANPRSKLFISTRVGRIAMGFSTVKFEPLPELRSRLILLMSVDVKESYCAETENHIKVILGKIAGLPVALSITNRSIFNEFGTNRLSIDRAAQLYPKELTDLADEYHEEYKEVDRILLATLDHLEKWGCSTVVQKKYSKTVELLDSVQNVGISRTVPKRYHGKDPRL